MTASIKDGFSIVEIDWVTGVIASTTVTGFKVTLDIPDTRVGVIVFNTEVSVAVKLLIAFTVEAVILLTTSISLILIDVMAFEVVWAIDDTTDTDETLDTRLIVSVVEVILDITSVLVSAIEETTVTGVVVKEDKTGVVDWVKLETTVELSRVKLSTSSTVLVPKVDIAFKVLVKILADFNTLVVSIFVFIEPTTLIVEISSIDVIVVFSPSPSREIVSKSSALFSIKSCRLFLHLQLHKNF